MSLGEEQAAPEAGVPAVDGPFGADRPRHVLDELGFAVRRVGDELHGSAPIVPGMEVPGTATVRTSILAAWVDVLTGLLTAGVVQPRVPVTLQLDVNLHRPPTGVTEVRASAQVEKAGQGVVVSTVDLADEDDRPFGRGTALFMVARDSELRLPADIDDLVAAMGTPRGGLSMPFAARAGCVVQAPGVVSIESAEDRSNSSQTLNGGLIALAAEEAALSLHPGATLSMMTVRYLRPVRVGPAVATARSYGDLAEVSVIDAGRSDLTAVLATTRTFGPDPG